MLSSASRGLKVVAECVVVSGLGGILSDVSKEYRIAYRPSKKDEEVAVSQ